MLMYVYYKFHLTLYTTFSNNILFSLVDQGAKETPVELKDYYANPYKNAAIWSKILKALFQAILSSTCW